MISPVRQWDVGGRGITGKIPQNYDSATCSSDDSLSIHKPLMKTTSHFKLPESYFNRHELSRINENRCSDFNKENLCGSFTEGSSAELFIPQPCRNILSDCSNRRIIDQAFQQYGDPLARFPTTPKPVTPGNVLLSPKTPPSGLKDRYVPTETKSALKKAAALGQEDFVSTLKKSGIDPDAHFASLSSKKKTTKKVNFECSTPKGYSKALGNCNTPLGNSSIIDTPVSGVKQLPSDLNLTGDSAFSFHLSTASSPQVQSENSFFESSPDKYLPPEVKATLLSGIVCYVDCRTEKEDRTESVQAELLSLGAKVEKNFTKKVTHVVFKEGRMSTYIKAKKENIPLVGILWIEACKRVQGIADPGLYRPKKMQKYDRLLPFQMITVIKHVILQKRRLAILNPKSRVRRNLMLLCGETPPPSPERKKRSRKAVTDTKGLRKREVGETVTHERHCHKKLFDNGDKNPDLDDVILIESSSSDNSSLLRDAARIRRKSAPAKMLSKKNAKKADIKLYFKKIDAFVKKSNEDIGNDVSSARKELGNLLTEEAVAEGGGPVVSEPLLGEAQPAREKKRRKLFDPNESFSLSQRSDIDVTSVEDPYAGTPKRVRTKATCGTRPMKLGISRKLEASLRPTGDYGRESSPSGQWFVERTDCLSQQKHPPAISFTSIPKSDMPKFIDIVTKLGKFDIEEKVTRSTTHLVCNGPRRTINLIKGIARGCWLVDVKWVLDSEAAGRWLSPEEYDLSVAFPAAADCCKVRRSLKSSRVIDIFKGTGRIYVSRKLKGSPHFSDVEELLRLCAARVVPSAADADIVIGKKGRAASSAVYVSVKWVLDCVTQNLLLPFHDFIESEQLSQETQDK